MTDIFPCTRIVDGNKIIFCNLPNLTLKKAFQLKPVQEVVYIFFPFLELLVFLAFITDFTKNSNINIAYFFLLSQIAVFLLSGLVLFYQIWFYLKYRNIPFHMIVTAEEIFYNSPRENWNIKVSDIKAIVKVEITDGFDYAFLVDNKQILLFPTILQSTKILVEEISFFCKIPYNY